jgi:hypothetical protein
MLVRMCVGLNSLHKYLYAGANPVNAYDPSGHDLTSLLVTIGIGAELLGTLSVGLGVVNRITHWGLSGPQIGGDDISTQLENLRSDALNQWSTTPSTTQASELSYLSSPLSFWRAWDINELYSTRDVLSPSGTAPGTVTVDGDVYWDDQVNYYWYGVIAKLNDLHSGTNTLGSVLSRVTAYRVVLWGGTDITERKEWVKAGYYGSFNYVTDTDSPLNTYAPGAKYGGFISAYFGAHDGSDTFVAVGSPF